MPFLAGQKLTADLLNEINQLARKTANETISSTATLQDDNHLVLPVAANTVHRVRVHVPFVSPAAAGLRTGFSVPTGATFSGGGFANLRSGATPQYGYANATDGGIAGLTGYSADALLIIEYVLTVSTTAGNIQFRWAQDVSNAGGTTLYAGGTMELQRIA